jgi:hypothetical protein
MDEVSEFYDELSAQYHLLYADWDEAVARHGRVMDGLMRPAASAPRRSAWLSAATRLPGPI